MFKLNKPYCMTKALIIAKFFWPKIINKKFWLREYVTLLFLRCVFTISYLPLNLILCELYSFP